MTIMKRSASCVLAIISLGVVGCSSIVLPNAAPAKSIYRLYEANDSSTQKTSAAITIRVDRPRVTDALQGKNLLAVTEKGRLLVIDDAQWVEALPNQIQASLVKALNEEDELVGILPTSGARTDFRAHITVESFEAHFDKGTASTPNIRLAYYVTLSNASTRDLIGAGEFSRNIRAKSRSVSDIVAAKRETNKAVLTEISKWIRDQLNDEKVKA